MATVDLITISRQFGAGGSELARLLGQGLGWRVLDRDIIKSASEQLDADPAATEHNDERVVGVLESIAKTFASGSPEMPVVEPTYEIDPDALAKSTHRTILAAAQRPPLVIVGHGVQCLFAKRANTLHVRVVAPLAVRAAHVAERMQLDLEAATAETQKRDTQRAKYLRHHFDCDNNDPVLYSVQFNTARIAVPDVARAISQLLGAA